MNIRRAAIFSECRTWRYTLDRAWSAGHNLVVFCLLNASTADQHVDDPTNRRGIGFARLWGFDAVSFVNLFAYRTPYPSVLKTASDPVGPDNDRWIVQRAQEASLIVLAYGVHGVYRDRDRDVLRLLSPFKLHCLGRTTGGQPKHILYLPKTATIEEFVI